MQSSPNAYAIGDDADRERFLQQILGSRHFRKSPRLQDFLRYICARAVARRFDEISEQQIAMHVFGRSADHNAAEDTIVRTAARQLRQKLELYSLDEGAGSDWRLTIPRGSYIPHFERVAVERTTPAEPEAVRLSRRVPRRLALALGAAAACCALAWGGMVLADTMDPRAVFWRAILPANQTTILVSGDSGLPILQAETHQPVHVQEYAAGKFAPPPMMEQPTQAGADPRMNYWRRRYTSVADLMMALKTASVAQKMGRDLDVRYARDISLHDLKAGNAILVGGPGGNPWVELYAQQLNFDFQLAAANSSLIVNREPINQEEAAYRTYPGGPNKTYAVIALTAGLDGHSRVLMLEGTSVAGTDAAADFLFNSERFGDVLKSAVHGWSIDDFEVLIETENVAASGAQTKVIGVRIHRR